MTKDEAKAYLLQLATETGLPEEQRKAVEAALGSAAFADKVADGFMRADDYSRGKNKLADEKKAADAEYAKKHGELKTWAEQYASVIDTANKVKAGYDKYVQTYGALDDTGTGANNNGAGGAKGTLTEEQVRKMLDDHAASTSAGLAHVVKSMTKSSMDYYKRFGQPMDVDAFETFVVEHRKNNPALDLDTAYKQWIDPEVEKRRQADFDQKVKEAREEGRKAALSEARIPIDSGPKEYSPAWDPKRHELAKMSPAEGEDYAREEFFKGWNEAAASQ